MQSSFIDIVSFSIKCTFHRHRRWCWRWCYYYSLVLCCCCCWLSMVVRTLSGSRAALFPRLSHTFRCRIAFGLIYFTHLSRWMVQPVEWRHLLSGNMNTRKMATYSFIKYYIWLYSIYNYAITFIDTHIDACTQRERVRGGRERAREWSTLRTLFECAFPFNCLSLSLSLGFQFPYCSLSSLKLSNANNSNFYYKYPTTDSDVMMVFRFVHINL